MLGSHKQKQTELVMPKALGQTASAKSMLFGVHLRHRATHAKGIVSLGRRTRINGYQKEIVGGSSAWHPKSKARDKPDKGRQLCRTKVIDRVSPDPKIAHAMVFGPAYLPQKTDRIGERN